MDSLELLYDHYKDSFNLTKKSESARNKLFIRLCVLIGILFLLEIDSNAVISAINSSIGIALKTNIAFSLNIIQSVIWIVTLYFTLRYYQVNVYIERQYTYIHSLEKALTKDLSFALEREGKNYVDKYPAFLNAVYFIYRKAFPLIYLLLVVSKLILEFVHISTVLNYFFNLSVGLSIIVITILYLFFLHKKN